MACCIHVQSVPVCEEKDFIWAAITFSFIQIPSLIFFICFAAGVIVEEGCSKGMIFPLFIIVPFPLIVFLQQVGSIFIDKLEVLSATLLFGEGSLEACPQLLLLLYTVLADVEREVSLIQKLSIGSSIGAIAKTIIELFASESHLRVHKNISEYDSYNDSLLMDRGFFSKLWLMAAISPAFMTSFIYRVGCLAIVVVLFKAYSGIYIAFGVLVTFIVSFDGKGVGLTIIFAITNVGIIAKCSFFNRKYYSTPWPF